jgi:hypothetical protein
LGAADVMVEAAAVAAVVIAANLKLIAVTVVLAGVRLWLPHGRQADLRGTGGRERAGWADGRMC